MSGMQRLRLLVSERLTAAAEEVLGLVEKTITKYQEELVRSRREVIQLRQQVEQLTVLQPRVSLFKEEVQTVLENQDLPPAEEQTETLEHQQVKEEPLEFCTSPDLEADSSEAVGFLHHDSETEPQTESQLLPGDGSITVILNNDTDEEWIEEVQTVLENQDLPPAEEQTETLEHQLVKEEPLEFCTSPDLEADSSEAVGFLHHDSETEPQTESQLLPGDGSITATLNNDTDEEWIDDIFSGSSSIGQSCSAASLLQYKKKRIRQPCHICHLSFSSDALLIKHMARSHRGHKAFKCPECSKEFPRKVNLRLHLRVHTGEKPYMCPYCRRSFRQSSNLNVHIRLHTGEKPYYCDSCRKMVTHSSHFKMCSKHPAAKCDVNAFVHCFCGKIFPTKSRLKIHMKVHEARKKCAEVKISA